MNYETGFCVRTNSSVNSIGRLRFTAAMKRDSTTTWKMCVAECDSANGDKAAIEAWMLKFTGKNSSGFNADCKIIARGADADGCYWILQPVHFY